MGPVLQIHSIWKKQGKMFRVISFRQLRQRQAAKVGIKIIMGVVSLAGFEDGACPRFM
jgi:hypothetical protein